eukprot:GO255753.1.p1 GENE.GO255753.1~~GO255753.1.p1  ORF type:complete len:195 (+),score=62.66 GO255753.1:58-585(+)
MATFETEEEVDGATVKKTWFSTGDRGLIDDDDFLLVHGNSSELRAAELEKRAAAEEAQREADVAAASLKAKEEAEEAERLEQERMEAERIAEEKRLEEERIAEEKRLEEERIAREEEEEKKKKEVAERTAALARVGVENPEDLDDETADAILARLAAIEANLTRLQEDIEGRNAA